jgi:serine/threonine protein kinase
LPTDDPTAKTPSTDDQDTAVVIPTKGAAAGTLLKDRYLLIRQLNEGGFGTVHLAQDQQMHGRPVVVKIQINQAVDDPWFERKFSEEVRALSMIDHPGVVVAIDSGRTPDGKPFLVMQYVDGVTLRTVMNSDGMPLDRAASILKQVGHALAAAHEKGIWHRDLKPENLMLQTLTGTGERVRLIDFGIATVADIRNRIETNTRVAGSFLYMAPEQALGQPSALTDIYAMGLIAYEMVTGRKPFVAENAVQLASLQREGVRVKPSDLRPALPAAAEQLILRSLDYDPAKRPQNALEFGDRLHDALLGTAAPAMAPAPLAALLDTPRNKRWAIPVAVLLALLLYNRLDRRPPPKKPAAPAKSESAAANGSSEQSIELAFWDSVKDSTEPQLYREYLSKYPNGQFASLANAKLEILARKEEPKSPAPAAQPDTSANEQAVELAFWNSVKDGTDPRLYQDYLDKYPHGRFESLARTKLDMLARGADHGPRRPPPPDSDGMRELASADPKLSTELSDWRALNNVTDPQAYRDYLAKYPQGMFASLARIKIASLTGEDRPPFEHGGRGPRGMPPLPPLRPAIALDRYTGPQQGELHWTGSLEKNAPVIVQGGKASSGTLLNDLPRVPVTVEVVTGAVRVGEAPASHNHWDRLVFKNKSDAPVTDVVIRWKVAK